MSVATRRADPAHAAVMPAGCATVPSPEHCLPGPGVYRDGRRGQAGVHSLWSTTGALRRGSHVQPIISVQNLDKTYASGFQALKNVSLDIRKGEIFALLGPNGAGKTTLISIICGIVNPSSGTVLADGHDVVAEYRAAR